MVFQLKCTGDGEKIYCSAKLDTGNAKFFYDCNGVKTELTEIHSGDNISPVIEELQKGTVYIIIETSEPCQEGRFTFDLEK